MLSNSLFLLCAIYSLILSTEIHQLFNFINQSVTNTTRKDAEEFLRFADKIPIKTNTRSYFLEQANLALKDMKESKINGAAVLKIE